MRIAVSADNQNGLDSVISPHFGRCPFFVLVDVDGMAVEQVQAVANPFYEGHRPGQVPGFIHSQGADVMLTGGMGGRAIAFFRDFGIRPVTGASGTVRRALEHFFQGELQNAAPCKESVEHGHGEMPAQGEYEKDEVGRLREEIEVMQQQLDEMSDRLPKSD